MYGETMNAAAMIPAMERNDDATCAKLDESCESTAWKSAVNLFKIRPVGTVSSHRNGVRRTLYVISRKTFRDAVRDPRYTA